MTTKIDPPVKAKAHKAAVKGQKGFSKGLSGNPKGRPRGSRNKATLMAQALLDGEAENITRKLIDEALSSNMQALKLCIERLVGPRKSQPLLCQLPPIETPADIARAYDALWAALGEGELTPQESSPFLAVLDGKRKAIETDQLQVEIERIKAHVKLETEIDEDAQRDWGY